MLNEAQIKYINDKNEEKRNATKALEYLNSLTIGKNKEEEIYINTCDCASKYSDWDRGLMSKKD